MECYIKYNILRILRCNLEKTIHFYTKICGMKYVVKTVRKHGYPYTWSDDKLHIFTYEKKTESYHPTGVCFIVDENFVTDYKNRGYWKIGLSLFDVNAAARLFRKNGYEVEDGKQFLDVGFLTFVKDPNGYSIELLQHTFEKNFRPFGTEEASNLNQPIFHPPNIGQVTLECRASKLTYDFYVDILGMKPVCEETPTNMPFTLYFFAYTDEPPVNEKLSAVENREWLYSKEFSQMEFRYKRNTLPDFRYTTNDENYGSKISHVGLCVHVTSERLNEIIRKVNHCDVRHESDGTDNVFLYDPDGYLIQVSH